MAGLKRPTGQSTPVPNFRKIDQPSVRRAPWRRLLAGPGYAKGFDLGVDNPATYPAISPDGRTVAYVTQQFRAEVRRNLQVTDQRASASTSSSRKMVALKIVLTALVLIGVVATISGLWPKHNAVAVSSVAQPGERHATAPPAPPPIEVPPPAKLSTAQIAALATPAVVIVENYNENGDKAGQGSGYVYSTGVVITTYHVIRGAAAIIVKSASRGQVHAESLLGYSIENDIAALQVPGSALTPTTSTPSDTVNAIIRQNSDEQKRRTRQFFSDVANQMQDKHDTESIQTQNPSDDSSRGVLQTEEDPHVNVGDRVVAIGAPLGLVNTVCEGIISAVRDGDGRHVLQTTASISPGSSGGPLLNDYGKVIGLTTSTIRDGQNLNFVIASSHIPEILHHSRQLSFTDLRSETLVSQPFPSDTIPVPARNARRLQFSVEQQQGAVLQGTYTITGGSGQDVGVMLLTVAGSVVVNSSRVSASGQFDHRLPRGQYAIIFDNRFSTLSSKSVSPDLSLVYYR